MLIVEDNEFNRDILKRRISKWGCRADCAVDGMEAIERLADPDANYDLIMLDISMPRKDGFEVLEYIQSRQELSSVPVIMISAIGDSKTVLRTLKMGASDFVMKPFNAVELSVRLNSCLKVKKLRDQTSGQGSQFSVIGKYGHAIAEKKKA